MRAKQFLTEYYNYDIEKMQSRLLQDNSAEHYADEFSNYYNFANQLPEWLSQYDPTQNNKYVNWMLVKYLKGGIQRLEDIPAKIADALELYSRLALKKKLEPLHRDINRFKGTNDLLDVYDFYKEKYADQEDDISASKQDKAKSIEQEMIDNKEVHILHNDAEYKVVIPVTHRASCYFGKNTRWCTTSENSPMYHDMYSKDGPLVVILHKPSNSRWQFHYPTKQYMDEQDSQINLQDFFVEHPKMVKLFMKMGQKDESGMVESLGDGLVLLFGSVVARETGELVNLSDLSDIAPEALPKIINAKIAETGYDILDIRDGNVIINKWKDITEFASELQDITGEWHGRDNPSIFWGLKELEEPEMADFHDSDVDGFFAYHTNPKLDKVMEKAMKAELDNLGVEYEEDESNSGLYDILQSEASWDSEVFLAINNGIRYGEETGRYKELSSDVWSAIDEVATSYGGHVIFYGGQPAFDTEVFLVAPLNDFMQEMNSEYFEENLGYSGWLNEEFLERGAGFVEQPRYGWSGFDEDSANQHIMSELGAYAK